MDDKILKLKKEIEDRLSSISELGELEQLRVSCLGKKGSITALLKGMNLEEGATTIQRNGQIGGHKA